MTYVFLGPSLPLKEAKTLLDAHYLPPAKQGDIISLVEEKKPHTIALIDGFFFQRLSVWHKEILYALSKGITVLGASSMGALRAAETERFGMIGVGEIFKLYRDGLTDDDEVALVHGPAEIGYLNLSLSMVNIRFTLKHAVANGLLSEELAKRAIDQAKSLHYTQRNLENVMPDLLKPIFQFHYQDQKKEDAKQLLQKISSQSLKPSSQQEPFCFCYSSHMRSIFYQERSVTVDNVKIPLGSIAKHVALHHPNFSQLKARALNRILVNVLAKILKIEVKEEEIEEEEKKFRKKIKRFEKWLQENHLSQEDFRQLMQERAKAQKLYYSSFAGQKRWRLHKAILDELRLSKKYTHWTKKAALVESALPFYLDSEENEIDAQNLCKSHYKETEWDLDTDIIKWCEESGFENLNDLIYELHRAQQARSSFEKHLFATLFDSQ